MRKNLEGLYQETIQQNYDKGKVWFHSSDLTEQIKCGDEGNSNLRRSLGRVLASVGIHDPSRAAHKTLSVLEHRGVIEGWLELGDNHTAEYVYRLSYTQTELLPESFISLTPPDRTVRS